MPINSFQIVQDSSGSSNSALLQAPLYVDAVVLSTNTPVSHTIPSGAKKVLFSATGNFYASYEGAASIPTVQVTDGSAAELNPAGRSIEGFTTISLIAPQNAIVTMAFFA